MGIVVVFYLLYMVNKFSFEEMRHYANKTNKTNKKNVLVVIDLRSELAAAA